MKRHPLDRKSKLTLYAAIQCAVLNDDCSGLLEDEPMITPALAILAMAYGASDSLVTKVARSLMDALQRPVSADCGNPVK